MRRRAQHESGQRAKILCSVRSQLEVGEVTSVDYDLMPSDVFEEYILRAAALKEEDVNSMEFLETLRIIQNQIGYPEGMGEFHALRLALHPLCVWMLDHMNDAACELACPYIVHIFVDMFILVPCFRSRFLFGDSRGSEVFIERVHHVAKMFNGDWTEIAYIFFYNIFSFRPTTVFAESYTRDIIMGLNIDDERSCFWIPLVLVSILRENRLSLEANAVFIVKMAEILRWTESTDHRRACMWCVYYWMKISAPLHEVEVLGDPIVPEQLDANGYPIREKKIITVTAVNQLTPEFIHTIHKMLECAESDIVQIALHVITSMWAVEHTPEVRAALEKRAKFKRIMPALASEDSLTSRYALLWLANMIAATKDQKYLTWWVVDENLPVILMNHLADGSWEQKETAARIVCLIVHRAMNDDGLGLLTPEIAMMLADMVGSSSRGITAMVLSTFTSALPRLPELGELLEDIGFDEKLIDLSEQDEWIGMEDEILGIIHHRRMMKEEEDGVGSDFV